jgi:hypothetical protein
MYKLSPEKNKVACKKYYYGHLEQQRERSRIKGKKSGVSYHLMQRYGVDLEEKNSILQGQDNRCKICGTTDPGSRGWAIDHNHETGKIRGVLCFRCNGGIGLLRDNANLVYSAACYLRDAMMEEYNG